MLNRFGQRGLEEAGVLASTLPLLLLRRGSLGLVERVSREEGPICQVVCGLEKRRQMDAWSAYGELSELASVFSGGTNMDRR